MVLTSIPRSQTPGKAGLLFGVGIHDADTYINGRTPVLGVWDIVITPPGGATSYQFLINGVLIAVGPDAGAAAVIRDLFLAAIAASPYASAVVTAAASGNNVRITQISNDVPVVVVENDANLALNVVTAAVNREPMRAGIMVAKAAVGAAGPQSSRDRICRLLATGDAATVFAGITILEHHHPVDGIYGPTNPSDLVFPPNTPIGCLKRGGIWVRTEEAVTPASPVFVRITATANGAILGNFRASADGGAAIADTRLQFRGSAGANGLVELIANIP